MKAIRKVLVIKLSAVGDFVLALPAFERIREAHPEAKITLLTTPPFEALARSSPFFNTVEIAGRPENPAGWLALVARLRAANYDRVYDLQNSGRTNLYARRKSNIDCFWQRVYAFMDHQQRDLILD